MFKINDVVVYESRGVYKIQKIDMLDFLKTKEEYYIMHPVNNDGSTIYVRTDNDKVAMRGVISKEKAEDFLSELPEMEVLYDQNDKVREKEYQSVLRSGECGRYFSMMKGIRKEQEKRSESGKKLSMNDDRNLHKVENILLVELSVVFNITVDQVKVKINDAIK